MAPRIMELGDKGKCRLSLLIQMISFHYFTNDDFRRVLSIQYFLESYTVYYSFLSCMTYPFLSALFMEELSDGLVLKMV